MKFDVVIFFVTQDGIVSRGINLPWRRLQFHFVRNLYEISLKIGWSLMGILFQSDLRVCVAEENLGLVASWRDAWIPEVFICISKTFCTVHHYHSGEAISCDFWRWCRGLSSLVWHGNWKFAKQKKKHLFTNARYRWLVNMWTAYGGRKDLAAISLQRQTMRVHKTFVWLGQSRPTSSKA